MEKDLIFQKQAYYREQLTKLLTMNVDEIVEERLQDEKARLRQIVETEIKQDITKCQNYLDLLAELEKDVQYTETENKQEEQTNNIVEERTYDN